MDNLPPSSPGVDEDVDGWRGEVALPHPDELHQLDVEQLTAVDLDDRPPWVPFDQRPEPADRVWLHDQLDQRAS